MSLNPIQRRNLLFLLLLIEYGKTQREIAEFFTVSPSTVSNGIKEAKYLKTIHEYKYEIQSLRQELIKTMGPTKQTPLQQIVYRIPTEPF